MPALKVSDRVVKRLQDIARKMGGGYVQVGFLEGATHETSEGPMPTAQIAFWNEFGHGGNFPSPPRPFFQPMIDKESSDWPKWMAAYAKLADYDGAEVLRQMGEAIAGRLQKSITDVNGPALSPTTLVLRKRFGNSPEKITFADVLSAQRAAASGVPGATGTQAHPLIWTGHMLNSVDYEVKR